VNKYKVGDRAYFRKTKCKVTGMAGKHLIISLGGWLSCSVLPCEIKPIITLKAELK